MAQNIDLRVQASTPTTPDSADKFTYYITTSGVLNVVTPDGATYQANQLFTSSVAMLGQSVSNGASGTVAGYLPVIGPSGEAWAIPAYVRA